MNHMRPTMSRVKNKDSKGEKTMCKDGCEVERDVMDEG